MLGQQNRKKQSLPRQSEPLLCGELLNVPHFYDQLPVFHDDPGSSPLPQASGQINHYHCNMSMSMKLCNKTNTEHFCSDCFSHIQDNIRTW